MVTTPVSMVVRRRRVYRYRVVPSWRRDGTITAVIYPNATRAGDYLEDFLAGAGYDYDVREVRGATVFIVRNLTPDEYTALVARLGN